MPSAAALALTRSSSAGLTVPSQQKYGKSAAQVALRWNVQRDVVVIPKSVHKG